MELSHLKASILVIVAILVAATVFMVAVALQPPSPRPRESGQQQQEHSSSPQRNADAQRQPGVVQAPIDSPLIGQPAQKQTGNPAEHQDNAAGIGWGDWPAWWLVGITLTYTIISFFLWHATNKSMHASVRAAKAANDAVRFANRPRLTVRHIVVDGIDRGEIGERLVNGYAWVTNTGALTVTLLHVHAQWFLAKVLPLENPALLAQDTKTAPTVMLPASFTKIPLPDRDLEPDSLDEHVRLWGDGRPSPKSRRLFLIGYIKYRDEIGLRRTFYCYEYSIRRNRFMRVKHPNYSYTD